MPTSHNKQSTQMCRWLPFDDNSEMTGVAVRDILSTAQAAISQRGAFHIVLAGGTTPKQIYQALRTSQTDWMAWHIYFGDERCLAADHSDRNSHMAAEAWLQHVNIPSEQIHPMPTEEGLTIAAKKYAAIVSRVALFDLVLLGLGEDGHTASLFPDHDAGEAANSPDVLSITDAPKPPPERLSLSAHKLSQSRQVMFFVTGNSKQQAVSNWRAGITIPAATIKPSSGVDIYIERQLIS